MIGNQTYWKNHVQIIILSQIGANRYQNSILEIILLSPLWSTVQSYFLFYFVGIPYRKVCMTKQMQAVNKFAIISKDYRPRLINECEKE